MCQIEVVVVVVRVSESAGPYIQFPFRSLPLKCQRSSTPGIDISSRGSHPLRYLHIKNVPLVRTSITAILKLKVIFFFFTCTIYIVIGGSLNT